MSETLCQRLFLQCVQNFCDERERLSSPHRYMLDHNKAYISAMFKLLTAYVNVLCYMMVNGWYLDVMFLRYTPCIRTPDPDLTTKSVKRDKISSVHRFYPWKSDRCLRATNGRKKFNKLEKVLVYHTIPVLFYLTAQISVIYYVQKWLPADGLNQIRPTAQLTLRGKSWRSSLDREQWDLIHLNYGACFNGQHVRTCTSAWCQHK